MEGHIPQPEPEPELDNTIIITSSTFRSLPFNLLNFINRLPVMGATIDPSVSSESLEERVANDSFHQQDPYKKVCSKDFINSLPVQKVSEEMIQQELTCGICLDQLQLGEDVIELPCQDKHYFHIKKENCDGIYPWLKTNNTCPMCRHEFPYKEKKNEPSNESQESRESQESQEQNTIPNMTHRIIPINPSMIQNLLDEVMQEQEDRMIQQAILESMK